MTPEDQAAFESALELIPQYDITRSDLQNLFNAALAHRDAQVAGLVEALRIAVDTDLGAEWIWPESAKEQWLKNAKAALAAWEASK